MLCLLGLALLAVPAAQARIAAPLSGASVAAYRGDGAGSDYLRDATTGGISGIVKSGTGAPLGGIQVAAYRDAGVFWVYVADTSTDAVSGGYHLRTLSAGLYYVKFFDPVGFYLSQWYELKSSSASATPVTVVSGAATTGVDATMLVKVVLGKPICPRAVRHGTRFTVSGTLRPQFQAGSSTVRLKVYRYTNGKWRLYRRYATRNADSGTASRYHARISIARAGKYRFKALVAATTVWGAARTSFSRMLVVK
jgi:hypothetical protein